MAEIAESSLGTLRRPNNTRGRWLNQSVPDNRALTRPHQAPLHQATLDCGWKDVVGEWMIPRNFQRLIQIELVNCAPRSEVITDRTPKVGTQDWSKTLAHSSAVVDWRGIVSGHLLFLSTMVNRNVYPQDWGRGSTRSTWIWENLRPGTGICWMGDLIWVWILLCWQSRQDWDHKFTSMDRPS